MSAAGAYRASGQGTIVAKTRLSAWLMTAAKVGGNSTVGFAFASVPLPV